MTKETNKEIEVRDKQAVQTASGEPTWSGQFFTPAADIRSNDNEITLVLDMPGVTQGDLDIDLREGVLTVVGKVADEPVNYRALQQEYEIGGYLRKFNISDQIDRDGIAATLSDGVLTLVLPKAEQARPRKIQVQVS
jgi:HSP20 family protein